MWQLVSKRNDKPLLKQWILCIFNPRPIWIIQYLYGLYMLFLFCLVFSVVGKSLNVMFVCFKVPRKVGSKDGKSFKKEQQWCDTCCYRHALCPYVCKYHLNVYISTIYGCITTPLIYVIPIVWLTRLLLFHLSLQPMHDDYDLRQEQLNKASLLSSKKFLENLLEKFITNVVHFFFYFQQAGCSLSSG